MNKLLCSAAVLGLVLAATPARAQVELELGGWFKGYGVYADQDEDAADVNDIDMIRHTEVHFGGETTLDNGLTVGAHLETEADGGDSFEVEESYVYMSGDWGRVNVGAEDGAAYLLQVAAPAADDNYDGLRQFVQPFNFAAFGFTPPGGTAAVGTVAANGEETAFDYDQDIAGYSDKVTYLTPVFNGFQAGASFTPDTDDYADDLEGIGLDETPNAFGRTYEGGVRYEGQWNNVGMILGAGYSLADLENDAGIVAGDFTDDREAWNVGADFDIGPFGVGASYSEDDHGEISSAGAGSATADDEEIIVVGADYTTGPFKFGVSYYDSENSLGVDDLDTQRYTGGVVYTYGPGMTFRGSVTHAEFDDLPTAGGTDDADGTAVLLGTQVNF